MTMTLLAVLGVGLLLGMQHATDADHLAAVAALAGGDRSVAKGMRHGIAWGVGHSLMLLVVAGSVGALGWAITPEWAGRFEQVVGVMLIALGLNLAWRLRREGFHFHGHRHGDVAHFHGHTHRAARQPASLTRPAATHALEPHGHRHAMPVRSVAVGMVHGLAGSAALALLVGQTLPSPAWGLVYVAVFGLGSVLGMALLCGALSWSLARSAKRLTGVYRWFNAGAAAMSMLLGVRLLAAGAA
jgi:hypothetical protein